MLGFVCSRFEGGFQGLAGILSEHFRPFKMNQKALDLIVLIAAALKHPLANCTVKLCAGDFFKNRRTIIDLGTQKLRKSTLSEKRAAREGFIVHPEHFRHFCVPSEFLLCNNFPRFRTAIGQTHQFHLSITRLARALKLNAPARPPELSHGFEDNRG